MQSQANIPTEPHTMSRIEVDQYRRLGHSGYVLAYRERHHGDDPQPQELTDLAESADARRCGFIVRAFKAIIDIFT